MALTTKTYHPLSVFYDAEYDYLDLVHRDIPFFLSRFGKAHRSILEIGVGTGRAAVAFARVGHRVVGIDYDRDILSVARRKRKAAGLNSRQLELVFSNATNLNLGRRFDFACILFNTFLMFLTVEAQDACLRGVRRHLRPSGRLFLDILNPNFRMLADPKTSNIGPVHFNAYPIGKVARVTDVRRDSLTQMQNFAVKYTWTERGVRRAITNRFTLTWFTPRELRLLVERNGLVIEKLSGDYDGRDLCANSPRIIACCRPV